MSQLETRTEPMVVNFGPHHPSMHGVLRLVVTLDGEDLLIMKESDVMAVIETKTGKKGKKAA